MQVLGCRALVQDFDAGLRMQGVFGAGFRCRISVQDFVCRTLVQDFGAGLCVQDFGAILSVQDFGA